MRSFISILLLITLCLDFSIRLTGYLHCTIKIYAATITGQSVNGVEYCECLRYLAYSPDEDTPGDQIHKAPQTAGQQDYVTTQLQPMMTVIISASALTFRNIRELYAFRYAYGFFRPPRSISSC